MQDNLSLFFPKNKQKKQICSFMFELSAAVYSSYQQQCIVVQTDFQEKNFLLQYFK